MVTIKYARPDACDKCGACGGASKDSTIELPADCTVGNWVRVDMPDSRFLRAAAIAYVLPLVTFLSGLFLGYFFFDHQELIALLGGILGLLVGGLAIVIINHFIRQNSDWQPKVVAVYDQKPDTDDLGCIGF